MTKKLYYDNPYVDRFTAEVISCEPGKKGYLTVLDRTAFYPEGGGQSSDTGRFGGVKVLEVHEIDNVVIHTTDAPIEAGTKAEGHIDWKYRFERMQQHTGEHIVSGLISKHLKLDNIGFHMGSEFVTIDFNGEISGDEMDMIEKLANEAVFADIKVSTDYPDKKELEQIDYRSKKEIDGDVRLVTVPEYDICACCGTHTSTTGQIGAIKLLTAQKYKGGTRISMLCGFKAMEDYSYKNKSMYEISALLSAKMDKVVPAVKQSISEVNSLRLQISELQNKIVEMKASEIKDESDKILVFAEDMQPNDLRKFAVILCERYDQAAVFCGNDDGGYKYAVGSNKYDVRPISKKLNEELKGKGGGAKELAQGSVSENRKAIETFFEV